MLNITELFQDKACVICGLLTPRYLCKVHRKGFHYIADYGIFASKGRFRASAPQTSVFRALRAHFKKRTFQEVTFSWYPYARYDIVIPDLKLIVEYDGEQHFKFVPFYHKTYDGYKKYIEKERSKEFIAIEQGWMVKRFSFSEPIDEKGYIEKTVELFLSKNKKIGDKNV